MDVQTIMDELSELGADDIVTEENSSRKFGRKSQEVRAMFMSDIPEEKIENLIAESDWEVSISGDRVNVKREISV